jgi:hypothetical protein
VASFCTCGAQPPPDALFCHKCGKPQFEPPLLEEETPQAAVIPEAVAVPVRPPQNEISFHNSAAVRTGLLTALIGSLLGQLPIPPQELWLVVSLVLAGFLAVFLYQRRTGQVLSVVAGARMGWITGLFSFAIATVVFTVAVLSISNDKGFAAFYRELLQARMGPSADLDRFLDLLRDPAGMSIVVVLLLVMLFVMFTVFPILGGAIGAKVLERDRA